MKFSRIGIGSSVIVCALAIFQPGCKTSKPELWIYTSIYKEVIAEMDAPLQAALPEVDLRWFQGGSETIASKLNAELLVGRPKADLVLTSDPFWYEELKKGGHLLEYRSPAAGYVPAEYSDPSGAFVTVRLPVVTIGYNSQAISEKDAPRSWEDLTDLKWKGKIAMGSPLESGTSFTAVAMLSRKFGWDYFRVLRQHDLLSAGGNSTVVTRIETRERPVGILLLENILKAMTKGSPIRPVYPKEGVIPVSSPIAILKTSAHPEAAKKAYDWFLGPTAQAAMVKSGMYSLSPQAPLPPGGRPRSVEMQWNPTVLEELFAQRDLIKSKFSEMVLH